MAVKSYFDASSRKEVFVSRIEVEKPRLHVVSKKAMLCVRNCGLLMHLTIRGKQ